MATLQFFLLGAPHLEQQHQNINLSRRKAIAALAYLAVTRQPHSRDALATLLWPDQDQSGARANLRRDLSTLKQILGDRLLLMDQSLVSINPDADLWLDIDAFQAGLATEQRHSHANGQLCAECAAALTAAVDLYHGDFMAGFSLPDSPEFDEWQFFETERLRHLLAEALQRLIGWHTDQAEYEPAIAYARRWLALDALHEPAHRQLMQLYARAGQHAAALRQYQECARLLDEELGAPPDAETTALYEAIRTKQFLPPAAERENAPQVIEPEPRERYQIERLLGMGGYGEVYLGRDTVTRQAVVIKRLKPTLAAQDPSVVARFVREAQALRQLNHPNIVAILAAVEQDGEQRIVMEYVPGGTLRDLLHQEGALSSERSLSIALELADALSRAHHLNIIHRDLKPDNVLLAADGTPRLTDFGMARLTYDDMHLTKPGMVVGSPAYLSPEALRGEELDARSDIWSFGVLLYELLTGRAPFEGRQLMAVLSNILHAPAPDITQIRSDVPRPLADLVRRMLARDREERIASMRQVAAELEAIREGRSISRVDVREPSEAIAPAVLKSVGTTQSAWVSQRDLEQSIHFCQSADGARLAYATIGAGPPLVKAANWLSHLEFDWQSPIWRHWLIGLAQQHTLIRYDERGCGLSDWNVDDISFEAWVRDLETVVEATGLERFPLIGISKGGSIAIAYTARHPEKVSHLILYGAYARGRLIRNTEPQQAEEAELMTNLIRIGWGRENPAFRQVFASTFMPDGTQEQHRWFNDLQRASASPENAMRIYAGSNLTDVRDFAAQLRVPTLVLHARGDMRVPFEEGRLLASLIPGARLVTLESNNHLLLEHEPAWQTFLREVHEFLAATPERSPLRHATSAWTQGQAAPQDAEHSSPARHNLRPQATSFVGRGPELDEIRSHLIDDPACRLLTLIGPGGSGKTRLAMAVVHDVSNLFRHGARLVSLSTVNSPELILYTVAEVLGVKVAGPRTVSAQLFDYVRDKQLLLVLDNFEHLLAGAGVINDLLEAAPDLKIMTTSRERLNFRAEHVIRLAGLPFPLSENDNARDYDAVKLFVRRALNVRSDFALNEANLKVVARICRLVEGLPLALELAVRWLQVLSLEEIAAEIEKGLDVLAADTRDIPERHRNLRAVFDYSWGLLNAEEQRVLRRLSVFRGGFRRDAAAEVAGATLTILAALVDKSLLNMTADGRYRRHPLIVQYTREKLAEQVDEQYQARTAHAETYLRFLQKWGHELRGGRQKEALQVIEEELENIHAALHWAVAEQQIDLLRESWDTIDEFYLQRQRLPEGVEVFAHIIRDLDETNPAHVPVLGRALVVQAHFYFRLDRYDDSRQLAQRGLQLLQAAGDARGSMKGLNILGLTAWSTGDYTVARSNLQQALAMAEVQHEEGLRANYLNNLAILEKTSGNYTVAERYYREALALNEQRGNHLSRVRNLENLGELLYAQKKWQEAEAILQEGLAVSREMGFTQTTSHLLASLAAIAVARQEYARAQALYHEVLQIARDLGARASEGEAAQGLGRIALAQGEFAEAQQRFQLALQIAADTQSARLMLEALVDVAALLARVGRKIQAVELLTLMKQHPASAWQTREAARQQLAELGAALPSDQIAAATTHGQAQDVQLIVRRLIEELSNPQWLTTPGHSHRLPVQGTPFIGREKELAEIRALIFDNPACRLLALIGPGGIGKTRLAIEAGTQSADAFRDGAVLVALASVGAADFILPALAEALDFKLSGSAAPQDQLLNYLRDKQLLLIFDDFERVLIGAELLSDILRAAPDVKIVATSRERLNVAEEWAYEVPGMAFPRADDVTPDDGVLMLEKYGAVRLFVQRARQTVASFVPTPGDLDAITQICQLVEGSPLAIELAAAWVNVLDCAAIVEEMQRGLEILTTQQRDIPEHHRSMQVVFDRTWDRLNEDERRVFSQLSVFRGGFRRAAAQEVAEASLGILASLVNKSLLRRDPSGHYQVHELLRQYAAVQLALSNSAEQRSLDRHCRYYEALLQASFQHALDGRQLEEVRQVEAEFGNIRAAWSWAITHQRVEFIQQAIGPLWDFYEMFSRYVEGVDMLRQSLDFLKAQPRTEAVERSQLHNQVSLAWLHIRLGRLADAEACLQDALAAYERLGIPPVIGVATDPRVALGILASIRGDYQTMIQLGEEALRLSEQYDHGWNRPFAYYLLTRAAIAQGNFEQAQRYARQASLAAQESKNRWFLAYCLIELGNVALAQDRFVQAKEHYRASYAIRQEFSDREGMALALNRLGTATFRQGAFAEARSLYLQSLDLYRELSDRGGLASTLNGLGFVASGQADYEAAMQYFRQALQIAQDVQFAPLALWILLGIGELLLRNRRVERGVELLGLVEQHPASEREASLRARQCLDSARDQLPPAEFTAIYQRGQQLDLNHVAESLLTDLLVWQPAASLSAS